MTQRIKLFDPYIGTEEENAASKIIKSRFWASGAGTGQVSKFEKKFQRYLGCDDCIAVNSGTAALNLAMSLTEIKGYEVILPSLTFVATAHSILVNGGKPIFVDVDQETNCIDPKKIENAISKKTKAILPVHFGGMPCDIEKIQKICKNNDLYLIEDAAHAAGASHGNKKIGSHGNFVCFSFHPVKNLAMPTGGLISINDRAPKKFRKLLESRRWCGITNRVDADYDVKEMGWNYYMNEISAAIGLEQLKKLDKSNRIRKNIANKYHKKLNLEHKMPFNSDGVYHFFWIRVKSRAKFRKLMTNAGIETGIHYKPIHTMTMYKTKKKLNVTEQVGDEIVTLPTHPGLRDKDVDYIIDCVNKFS